MTEMKQFFAHGKESGPWGTRIRILATIAEEAGFSVESPDYSDLNDPDERAHLLAAFLANEGPVVLAGSSMGGYVSVLAAESPQVAGLFLMATALFIPGY